MERVKKLACGLAIGIVSAALIAPLGAAADPTPEAVAYQNIYNKAFALGWAGSTVSGLEAVPGGFRIRFQNCDIYYSPSTNAHAVNGGIRTKYNAVGGAANLGLPLTDEGVTPDQDGRYNHFSGNASIYWHPNTGPMVVRGAIRQTWADQGWEKGPLGYPTCDERSVGPDQWYSDFQNGVLFYHHPNIVPAVTIGLSRDQLVQVARKFFVTRNPLPDLQLNNVSIVANWLWIFKGSLSSETSGDWWQSLNRVICFRFEGEYEIPGINPTFNMYLYLRLYGKKDASGNVNVLAECTYWEINTWGPFFGIGAGQLANGLKQAIEKIFAQPVKLGSIPTAPGFLDVLSVKVMKDASLKIFLQPEGLLSPKGDPDFVRNALQQKLDDLARP